MAKTTLRAVLAAHAELGAAESRWGPNNLATGRALGKYWDLRKQWEKETGKDYHTHLMRKFK
jgi:hypothetical protein